MPIPRENQRVSENGNFLTKWMKAWEARKKAKQEDAARKISDDITKNANEILFKLDEIVLNGSKISDEEKNNVRILIDYAKNKLKNAPYISTDIRNIDERILMIADHLSEGVKNSNERQTRLARAALLRGIDDIRKALPPTYTGDPADWVNLNCEYLDKWLLLIEYADKVDSMQKVIDEQTELIMAKENSRMASVDALEKRSRDVNDAAYALMHDIAESRGVNDREKWTPEHWELHSQMVDMKVFDFSNKLTRRYLEYEKNEQQLLLGQLDQLKLAVSVMPDFSNPNLLNRYNEEIDRLFNEMTEMDTRINAALEGLINQQGRLAQLDTAAGSTLVHDVAATGARDFLEKLSEEQKKRQDILDRARKLRDENKVKTNEELAKFEAEEKERLAKLAHETAQQTVKQTERETIPV